MCLHIKKGTGIRTAKKRIEVFKVITSDNHSLFKHHYTWAPHSYRKANMAASREGCDRLVYDGFHAFRSPEWAMPYSIFPCRIPPEKIVRMYIPRGAKYYIGDDGDIVSNRIYSGTLKAI